MTFREFCRQHKVTRHEREELWWYFVALRLRVLFQMMERVR